jgi:hypothetical protein
MLADAESLNKSLEPRKSELVSLKDNLVDIVWGKERPAQPRNKIFQLDIKYSGPLSLFYMLSSLCFNAFLLRRIALKQDLSAPRRTDKEESQGYRHYHAGRSCLVVQLTRR